HAPSRQYFQIARRGDGLVFRRWQQDAAGHEVRVWETGIDWILGSGNHARVYLYRTPDGSLFQLPLAWYSQEKRWAMAPGFDRPDHDGVLRRVRRECLFCHDGYPDVPAGSDAPGMPQVFPAELPEGIGCQRCHGPGAEHIARALGGVELRERIREAIVNPARLPRERRDDVCFQCHLQPLVALSGVRRAGRGDFSFRPGEALPDYQAHVDTSEEKGAEADRFEINHQAWRLRQSLCFVKSAGRLSCLTCHDPHRRVPEDERAEHFRTACQTCHAGQACKRPRVSDPAVPVDTADCVSCHMPKRRPRDVVRVVMTDHLIRRRPGGSELLAPLAETEPTLTGARLVEPERLPAGNAAEILRTLPVVRLGTSEAAVDHLAKLVATDPAADPAPAPETRMDLAAGLLRRRRFGEAEKVLDDLAKREPPTAWFLQMQATAREGRGNTKEAEALYRAALARPDAEKAELSTLLARLLARQA